MSIKFRRVLSLILFLVSIFLIVWVSLPNHYRAVTQPISSSEMQLPSIGQGSMPTQMEMRQVELEWPSTMRIGEKEEIRLVFGPVETGASTPNKQRESSIIYNNYNIMAEARFEVAGISVSPANPTRESMPPGQTVNFTWQIKPDQSGTYDGTVWLSLRFLPLDGSPASQVPIFIHQVKIQAYSLFGMNETIAYFAGGSAALLSVVIVFGDMIDFIRRRMRKISNKSVQGTKVL
jgi:hypothetical protein